jgi:hypothetical protein
VHPLKPSLEQLQVVLEGLLRDEHVTGGWRLSSGLLLLAVLLSVADPPVRLAFLAGVPGEVLLRLLGEVAAGGRVVEKAGTLTTTLSTVFQQWQAQGVGLQGALGLADALAQGQGVLRPIPTRQAVLQMLLWCFFEVAPPQQQQQQKQQQQLDTPKQETADDSNSSSSRRVHNAQQEPQLLQAAQQGAVWMPGRLDGESGLPATFQPTTCNRCAATYMSADIPLHT